MAETYFLVITFTHLSFSSILYFLHKKWPSKFLAVFALAWLIESGRAAFLYVDLHLDQSENWYLLFDLAYIWVSWLIVSGIADFVGLRVRRRWLIIYTASALLLLLAVPEAIHWILKKGVSPDTDRLEALYLGPALLFMLGGSMRGLSSWWLYRYWRQHRLPGALIAALFMFFHALGSLFTPVELWMFAGDMPGSELFWFLQVLGLSVGVMVLVFNRQQADLIHSRETASCTLGRLMAVLDTASEGIITADADGRIVLTNRQLEALFDIPSARFLGKDLDKLLQLVAKEFRSTVSSQIDSLRQDESRASRSRITATREDGSTFPAELSLRTVRMSSRLLYTAAIQDLSEEVEAEERRKELEAEFLQAQKMEAIGRLSAGIAHDFNNLLTTIQMSAELLYERAEPGTLEITWAEEIRNASRSAAALTRRLLAFSRKQVLKPEPVDLSEAVRGLESMLERIVGRDIVLTIRGEPGCWAEIDRSQLEQVIMNLVVNARDAISDGGNIELRTERIEYRAPQPQGPFAIPPGRYVQLVVTDSGSGIPPETQDQVFEPFFTTKEPGKGTGLGLSTVYGIVKQSCGYITLSSETGKGSSFRLYFPEQNSLESPVAQEDSSHSRYCRYSQRS